jgi:hypothetical protein
VLVRMGCLSSGLTSYGERAITAGLSALHDGNEVTDDLSPPSENAGNQRAGLQPCGCVGVEPTIPRSNRTLRHGQIEDGPRRERAITVRKRSTAELHAPSNGCMAGVEPATSRLQGEVTAIYTTAKPAPGMCDKGREPLRDITIEGEK